MSRSAASDRRARRTTDDGRRTTDHRAGFTLVELLVVIVVLAILIALLLPAINGAMRTAREAAVSAEINQLATALEQFKTTYGDYPPSRIYLNESGDYSVINAGSSSQSVSTIDPTSLGGSNDITVAQLASRTLAAFRKFWPRMQLSTSGAVFGASSNVWYDFNGNGVHDTVSYVLHGHECLVFFLGGVPLYDTSSQTYTMSGFGKDPRNPFSNMIVGNAMYNANRQTPIYEFNGGRLFLDPSTQGSMSPPFPGIPGYYDSLNNSPPTSPLSGDGPVNFFVYFSAYGNGNYDPNDANIFEVDQNQQGIGLQYAVSYPVYGSATTPTLIASSSPNPYTSSLTGPSQGQTFSGTILYQKPQTYQILSAGSDGLYGIGGQYLQPSQSTTVSLPLDAAHVVNTQDGSVRQREYDNLSNFKQGRLQ